MAKAELFHIHPENPQMRLIGKTVDILNRGGIVVHPTDTTYAFGVHLENKKGIESLYRIKGKSLDRPLSLLCADLSNIAEYAKVDDVAYRAMRRLLPGPYTFILPATKAAPRITQTPRKEVGLRCPADNILQALASEIGLPLVSTSVRALDGELLADPDDIMRLFGHEVDLIIDAGYIYPEPSTIISFMEGFPEIIREGKGSVEDL
ncbi:MAG: L-threonylcarbamoyladenylate synthase [Candidatus Lernaella stagnicola]|nr:L-threonylcarbamoyladenylate synthase [Candidatus Lernaella stagnicola]